MKKIDKPTLGVKEVFLDCIDNMTDENLKDDLSKSLSIIEDAEKEFDDKKKKNLLYQIKPITSIGATITTEVLKSVYTDRMLKKGNKARAFYDSIFLSAPKGKCPLCSQRIVKTLDHYLPKANHPLLSVSPINLVPACTDCNKGKTTFSPKKSTDETLHPYYDNIEDDQWLKCKIHSVKPIIFEFYVDPPLLWDAILNERVKNHFDTFELDELYKIHASEEFENIRYQITRLFKKGGHVELKSFLEEAFDSRNKIDKNSWKTAFYGGLKESVAFCNGEFIE